MALTTANQILKGPRLEWSLVEMKVRWMAEQRVDLMALKTDAPKYLGFHLVVMSASPK